MNDCSGDCPAPLWHRRFEMLLGRCIGPRRALDLAARFMRRFGEDYRLRQNPSWAVRDCLRVDQLGPEQDDLLDLYPRRSDVANDRLQWFSRRDRALDECMPVLEHAGLRILDQIRFVDHTETDPVYLRSFFVRPAREDAALLRESRSRLLAALDAILNGRAADDELNALVVVSGLNWQDVEVLRAYCRYSGQLGGPLRRQRCERALLGHPAVASLLLTYFSARFDPLLVPGEPRQREEQYLEPIRVALSEQLQSVGQIADDRALRDLFNLIDATVRTNRYRPADPDDGVVVALKFDSDGIIDMPLPRPAYEVYVHSAEFEGVHLRGAKVARGGIRWSDRHDDLREEILGLQQTQMIKNALIVPQGAKGGFRLASPPSDPEALRRAGRAAYRRFIAALLEVTDTGPRTAASGPSWMIAYDEPDPYLVVAADKGTAGFSDDANEMARRAGFWLGDAFASGGSKGFDHKQYGITARGVWECVRRHFRELNRDLDREYLSVVGIGSMDGDVFGNGMLHSARIRLVGAFSARHIFLDPDPDPERSWRERKRLFEQPYSSWADYDPAVISRGGGLFPRDARRIELTPEVRTSLGLRYGVVDGDTLIRLLLTASVDLLWLGGIGTYVKSAEETHDDVGDRANDAVRIDASELRAAVIGEGANLGLTQRARVDFALRGGRINMDAVDNSAGVDLSDHEVNLKILLQQLVDDGQVAGSDARDTLLRELAPEVCSAVLAHNASQSLALSLDEMRCRRDPELFLQAAERLAGLGSLIGEWKDVADRQTVLARPHRCLTRPELTVLLARTKLALKSLLVAAGDDAVVAAFRDLYLAYFPVPVRSRFPDALIQHPLATEITISQIANYVIDHAGAIFLSWMDDVNPDQITRAVLIHHLFDSALDLDALRAQLRAMRTLDPDAELRALLTIEDALALMCRWGLRQSRRWLAADADSIGRWRNAWMDYRCALQERALGRAWGGAATPLEAAPLAHAESGVSPVLLVEPLWVMLFPHVAGLQRSAACSMVGAVEAFLDVAEWFCWPQFVPSLTLGPASSNSKLAVRAAAERLLDGIQRLSLAFLRSGESDFQALMARLTRQGKLARACSLRREWSGASAGKTLEVAVLLAADAEDAAVGLLGESAYL